MQFIRQLRKAYGRQKHLAKVLEKHSIQLESTRRIVRAISNDNLLHTFDVEVDLARLQVVGERLMKCLGELDPRDNTRSRTRRLAYHLLHGSRDEELLASILTDLDRAKTDLSLHLQRANLGLTQSIHNMLLLNIETADRKCCPLPGAIIENSELQIDQVFIHSGAQG